MRVRSCFGVGVALLAGCAQPHSAPVPTPAPSAGCQAYGVDPAWARRAPVYEPCDVEQPAAAIERAPTGYHSPDCENATATVVAVVDTAGIPEPRTARVVSSTSAAFAKAALNALRQWRYSPALKDGRKVRQVVQQRFDIQCRQVPQGAP
jgi:Gram-negative bacterial TonB protein C-terminal